VEIALELHGRPDILLVDAGFDAYQGEPLGAIYASANTYKKLAQLSKRIADRIVVVLEGGYSAGLRRGLPAYIAELLERPGPVEEKTVSRGRAYQETMENLRELCKNLGYTGGC